MWLPTFLPGVAKLAEKMRSALSDTLPSPASIACLHRIHYPKPCSPALAGAQIPALLHSLGLGKESVFLRFLTTLLPGHKDKELFISALLLNTHSCLRADLLLCLPRSAELGILLITIVICKPTHSRLSPSVPCSTVTLPVSPGTTCKSSLLPIPVLLGFQTLLFPNMAGMRALVSTCVQQQNLIPVVTLAGAVLHCHHRQQYHCNLWEVSLGGCTGHITKGILCRPNCTLF